MSHSQDVAKLNLNPSPECRTSGKRTWVNGRVFSGKMGSRGPVSPSVLFFLRSVSTHLPCAVTGRKKQSLRSFYSWMATLWITLTPSQVPTHPLSHEPTNDPPFPNQWSTDIFRALSEVHRVSHVTATAIVPDLTEFLFRLNKYHPSQGLWFYLLKGSLRNQRGNIIHFSLTQLYPHQICAPP